MEGLKMEQRNVVTTKDDAGVYQMLQNLLKQDKEFQIMITVPATGKEEDVLFAARRYDRMVNSSRIICGHTVPFRLHQEDLAQAMGIPASEKYEKKSDGYLKKMFQYIRLYAHDPIKDQLKLWDRVIYNYLVGNTDGHIKNYSLT